jgi:hypothetical protein
MKGCFMGYVSYSEDIVERQCECDFGIMTRIPGPAGTSPTEPTAVSQDEAEFSSYQARRRHLDKLTAADDGVERACVAIESNANASLLRGAQGQFIALANRVEKLRQTPARFAEYEELADQLAGLHVQINAGR